MNVALVHDYLNDFGGAERVLEVLAEMYPKAPIYTAFCRKDSTAYERFKHRDIRVSWAHHIPFFGWKLHSPFRFLAPAIWRSFDFSGYDLVISSSSWYMTKGIRVPKTTLHVSYIHTPPRYLYGYDTSINWRRHWPIRVYAGIVNKELRQFDYETAQTVDVLVANSQEVRERINKFWRRNAEVIYPPVKVSNYQLPISKLKRDYLLTGGRLVGPKHFDLAILAANELKTPLKIFGSGPEEARLKALAGPTVEFLGKVNDQVLFELYAKAKAFIVLADDEDFGITPVEAQLAGTPVIAYRGGGYLETVVEGETGVFFDALTIDEVIKAVKESSNFQFSSFKIKQQARKFSKERFVKEFGALLESELEKKRAV